MARLNDRLIKSKYAPHDTNVTWIDTSGLVPIQKSFINGKWMPLSRGGSGGGNCEGCIIGEDMFTETAKASMGFNTSGFMTSDTYSVNVVDGENLDWMYGKRCLVKPYIDNNNNYHVAVAYLDDNDSTKYADGSDAKLDGTEGVWMVDLPEFYYQGSINSDTYELSIGRQGIDGIANKSRRVFLGVTESYAIQGENSDYFNISVAYDTNGDAVQSTGNISPKNNYDYCRNLGIGWTAIDYETHCKLAYMYIARVGDILDITGANPDNLMNCQGVCGVDYRWYNANIGQTKDFGNALFGKHIDTEASASDGFNVGTFTLFGVEDPWGGKFEYVDGMLWHPSYGVNLVEQLVEDGGDWAAPTHIIRTISPQLENGGYDGYIKDFVWGNNTDLIPTYKGEYAAGDGSTYFADFGFLAAKPDWCSFGRSGSVSGGSYCGLFCLVGVCGPAAGGGVGCSRIQYRGEVIDMTDNIEAFKEITPIYGTEFSEYNGNGGGRGVS